MIDPDELSDEENDGTAAELRDVFVDDEP